MACDFLHRLSVKRHPDSPVTLAFSRFLGGRPISPLLAQRQEAGWVPAEGWGRQWAAQGQGPVWASARETITD